MPVHAYYRNDIPSFLSESSDAILGELARNHAFDLTVEGRRAWVEQLEMLKAELPGIPGRIFLEFAIPRMGKRADAVLVIGPYVLIVEFKVGAESFERSAINQVIDYALDLKNFHEGSHQAWIVPLLIASRSKAQPEIAFNFADDGIADVIKGGTGCIGRTIGYIWERCEASDIDIPRWESLGYRPTPTIIEAAKRLYESHRVEDIAKYDAGAVNLKETSNRIFEIISDARKGKKKVICFVTGVPGSGKTLAGLNIATQRSSEGLEEHAVFLSGNGPLVDVLREALARDKALRENIKKEDAHRQVKAFIQNIHHFRDEYFNESDVPRDKVVIFDEAQRAWSMDQASSFMRKKKNVHDFGMSEPEFLIGVMDRHVDWCTVICLVGGGQEINTGEAGITEWLNSIQSKFPHWEVCVSNKIDHIDYSGLSHIREALSVTKVTTLPELHLSTSMRSFRAETLSDVIGHIVENKCGIADSEYRKIRASYPIYVTRSIGAARRWLKSVSRGTERFGLVASSGAHRLRADGIFIKAKIDPPVWFLNGSEDVRSSCHMEEVATEFDVQGLELDWVGVCWDADFRYVQNEWCHFSFKGTKWLKVKSRERKLYLKNAYRVNLTRARQGMVIFLPSGDEADATCPPSFYDETHNYLLKCGIQLLPEI